MDTELYLLSIADTASRTGLGAFIIGALGAGLAAVTAHIAHEEATIENAKHEHDADYVPRRPDYALFARVGRWGLLLMVVGGVVYATTPTRASLLQAHLLREGKVVITAEHVEAAAETVKHVLESSAAEGAH